jgi:pimeloyl-ACP methyl ester carboxylesterase
MLPDRVLACAAIASLAPPVEVGAAWSTFWRPEQYAEWQELFAGDAEALRSDFEAAALMFGGMTLPRLRARADLDRLDTRGRDHHIETEVHPVLVRSMRRSVSRGYAGYMDDNLAQARDWGFRVADIRVPVVVRHGTLDRLVPVAHGRWLASAIPGARGVFLDDAGHGSVVLPFQELIAQLVSAAG